MPGPFRFAPPELGAQLIRRSELLKRLDARWAHRVTTVIAGPGFGKTTLLAQAYATNRLAPSGLDVWLTCEAADASASNLADGIATALGLDSVEPELLPERVSTSLSRSSPTNVCLVLDDVHVIEQGSTSAQLLADVIAALPANGHLVAASRGQPPFPTARLAAQRSVARLHEDELRFSDREVEAFSALTGSDGERLRVLGGWPAMLALSTLGEDPAQLLWEEVLDGLDQRRRRNLAVLAMLRSADAELLSRTIDEPVDLRALTEGIPLVARSADGTYQLHSLLETALTHDLSPNERETFRRRGAEALLERDDFEAALAILDLSRDWPVASEVIRVACSKYAAIPIETLARWRRTLPTERNDEPEALLIDGVLARHADPLGDDALRRCLEAAEGFGARGDGEEEAGALAHAAYLAWIQGDVARLLTMLARTRELDEAGVSRARWSVLFGEAMIAAVGGDDDVVLETVRKIPTVATDAQWIAIARWFEAMWSLNAGDLAAARTSAKVATDLAEPRFLSGRTVAALVSWYAGDPDGSDAFITALDEAQPFGFPRDQPIAGAYRALCHATRGETQAAEEAVQAARTGTHLVNEFEISLLHIADAITAITRHDEEAARRALDPVVAGVESRSVSVDRAVRAFLPILYVLAPSVRPRYDESELHGANVEARDIARAFVALREAADIEPIGSVRWPSTGRLRVVLPRPWLAEWAVAARAVGAEGADDLVATLMRDEPTAFLRELRRIAADASSELSKTAKALLSTLPALPAHHVRVRALGPTILERDGIAVDDADWRRNRVRTLLLYLIVHRRARRETVATALWPDRDSDAAANNLAVTLNYLHRALEPDHAKGAPHWFVRTDGEQLELAGGDALSVDGWDFERLITTADNAPLADDALTSYDEAIGLWRGEWLEELTDDWALGQRDRMRALFVRACVRAGELRLAASEPAVAIALAERAIATEPWSEEAFRLLVAAHHAAGDRAAARRAAGRCRAMLAELDVDAERATEMVLQSIDVSAARDPSVDAAGADGARY